MLKLSEIRKILSDKKWNLKEVSRQSGLEYMKLYYVLHGKNPPVLNVEKISDYLEGSQIQDFTPKNASLNQ